MARTEIEMLLKDFAESLGANEVIIEDHGRITNAYHGTSVECAKAIIESGFEHPVDGEWFLGPGFYFFETDPQAAYDWMVKYEHDDAPMVLKCTVIADKALFWNPLIEARENLRKLLRKEKGRPVTEINAGMALVQLLKDSGREFRSIVWHRRYRKMHRIFQIVLKIEHVDDIEEIEEYNDTLLIKTEG